MMNENDKRRFWSKVEKTASCWLWKSAVTPKGYGVFEFSMNGACYSARAHRVAYEDEHGSIPDGLLVLHRCDTPRCVRPDHLFLGDHAANAADKVAKGRQAHGESHGCAVLTCNKVRQIRSAFTGKHGELTSIARSFGVSVSTVSLITKNRIWKEA